jgi:hypothetical protein
MLVMVSRYHSLALGFGWGGRWLGRFSNGDARLTVNRPSETDERAGVRKAARHPEITHNPNSERMTFIISPQHTKCALEKAYYNN